MSTANPLNADHYEEVDGGPGEGRMMGFNNGSDDEAPQPLSPQYINNKRGNGVENTHGTYTTADISSKSAQSSADQGKALKIVIYGAVNAMMAIPILYGYAAIIFRYSSRTLDIDICLLRWRAAAQHQQQSCVLEWIRSEIRTLTRSCSQC